MAIIECEVIPIPGAGAEQLRQLGAALARWSRRESGDDGILQFICRNVLADLSYGKPPPIFLSQYENMLDESKAIYTATQSLTVEECRQRTRKLREDLGEERAQRHTIYFQVRGGAYANRKVIIDSLRQDIPRELVQDILINDSSWDQET